MKSFGIWFNTAIDAKTHGTKSATLKALVNINVWLTGKDVSDDVCVDFGIMVYPAERSENSIGHRVNETVSSISLYCPFVIDEERDRVEDVYQYYDADLLGAIFNDRCTFSDSDNTTSSEVRLGSDNEGSHFYVQNLTDRIHRPYEYRYDGTIITIDLDNNPQLKPLPVYVRFRLSGSGINTLVQNVNPNDRLLTSAFQKERILDFRLNDMRTLPTLLKERLAGHDKGVILADPYAVHLLIMASYSVDIDYEPDTSPNKGFKERRMLERELWQNYAPGHKVDNIVAWHWKQAKLDKSDGYTLYVKMKIGISNVSHIVMYIVLLFLLDVLFDIVKDVIYPWINLVLPWLPHQL